MNTFYDRLLQETDELKTRCEKLEGFLSSEKIDDIDPTQKVLLNIQHQAMLTYLMCLYERIDLLDREALEKKQEESR